MAAFDLGVPGTHAIEGDGDGVSVPFRQRVAISGGVNTDRSAAVPSGLLAGMTELSSFPVNLFRKGYIIMNGSAAQVIAKFWDGVSSTPTYLPIGSSGIAGQQGNALSWDSMPHTGQIDIWGPSGSWVAAAEW